jgi:iron complex transport system substrate-binding protein
MTGMRAQAISFCLLALPAMLRAGPPQRVASLNLTADEILVEILPPDRLVAATTAAEDPNSSSIVGRIPRSIPRFFRADMERLVALRPDLVIVSEYTDADFLNLLEQSGLSHHRMRGLDSLPGIRAAIERLGSAVGEAEPARELAARFDARLDALSEKLAGLSRPRVMYWSSPFTAGAGSAMGALIECGGALNVGAELGVEGLAPIGAERAFMADPDILLVGRTPGARRAAAEHPLLSQMRAVREGRIVEAPTRLLMSLSHHAAESCWFLASAFHPEHVPEPPP